MSLLHPLYPSLCLLHPLYPSLSILACSPRKRTTRRESTLESLRMRAESCGDIGEIWRRYRGDIAEI